ncbi:MAG: hypothetical protein Q9200_006937 [Gallowayella weberi]
MHFSHVIVTAILAALASASPRHPAELPFPGQFPIPTTSAVTATPVSMSNNGPIGPIGPIGRNDILPTGNFIPHQLLPSVDHSPLAHGPAMTDEEMHQCLNDHLACRHDIGIVSDYAICLRKFSPEDCRRLHYPYPSQHTTQQPSETGKGVAASAVEHHGGPAHHTTTMAPLETGHTSYVDQVTQYIGGHPYVGPIKPEVWQDYLCRHRHPGCYHSLPTTLMMVSRLEEQAARVTPTA